MAGLSNGFESACSRATGRTGGGSPVVQDGRIDEVGESVKIVAVARLRNHRNLAVDGDYDVEGFLPSGRP